MGVSAKASSLAVPAAQPLRTLSSHTPSTGAFAARRKHLPEFAPPCWPSQRQRYPVEMSAKAASLALPAEQPFLTLSSHTPSTGMNLMHLREFAPAFRPSQRHAYMLGSSGNAASLGLPEAQPLRRLSSHTPGTDTNLTHLSEFVPPLEPSQRHTWTAGPSGNTASLSVPDAQPFTTLSSQTP